jgi:hypothetical protein
MISLIKRVTTGGKQASENPGSNLTDTYRHSDISQAAVARACGASSAGLISVLSFFVPTICLLSCIPIALAWTHSPREVGTIADANFYQSIAGSLVQLLSLATLLWPTLFHSTFSGRSWFWTWILAVFSGGFTILSVPLYVFLPTAWSMAVAFGGMIAQALIVLQIVHAI